jgi:hypothetical protein
MPSFTPVSSWLLWIGLAGAAVTPALAACGESDPVPSDPGSTIDSGADPDTGDPFHTGSKTLLTVGVDPASAAIEILNGAAVTKSFTAVGHYSDGSSQPLVADVAWSADQPAVGQVDAAGVFTPTAKTGGLVTITATYKGLKASGSLVVKLHDTQNPSNAAGSVQSKLKSAVTPDAKVTWSYPYDKTVFPRGLGASTLMWSGTAKDDVFYIHLSSPYFELETFASAAPPSRFAFPDDEWAKFVDSTTGHADLVVDRWDGTTATQIARHAWTIAPASLRGTVYYWANNTGRIMRIKPGAKAPDDFSQGVIPAGGCTMTCHAVSADGSTLISGGGTFGGSYDLKANATVKSLGGDWNKSPQWYNTQWMAPAISPTGAYLLTNSMGAALSVAVGGPANFLGLYDSKTGAKVPNSGVDGLNAAMPAWSPDGSRLVWVAAGNPTSWGESWINPDLGNLQVASFSDKANPMTASPVDLVQAGSDPARRIVWPTVSPDGNWIVYGRARSADTRGGPSDLFMANAATPGSEVRLAQVDGDAYPFAAGARDLAANYEPTFAPVAAGGYFWFVFTSRRTYGNILTGAPDVTKQLWIAAVDQNPKPGQDASHPAFILSGQAADSLNMRGYFALDPCKADGQSCQGGTDCCGGYCDPSPDGGAPVCGPKQGCSKNGDKCDVSGDCCNAGAGVTCINHVCSEPTPN